MIYEAVDPNANIIFGALVDESMNGEIAITVIATGFPVMSTADSMKGTYVPLNLICFFSTLFVWFILHPA